jgi:hypothetical protein
MGATSFRKIRHWLTPCPAHLCCCSTTTYSGHLGQLLAPSPLPGWMRPSPSHCCSWLPTAQQQQQTARAADAAGQHDKNPMHMQHSAAAEAVAQKAGQRGEAGSPETTKQGEQQQQQQQPEQTASTLQAGGQGNITEPSAKRRCFPQSGGQPHQPAASRWAHVWHIAFVF